jgi:DNA-binding NtrC family response regulator
MILIVDDDAGIRSFLKTIISNYCECYSIFEFGCPLKAYDFFYENRDDVKLVISDFEMPNLDGCELITKMKQAKSNLKTGIVSGCIINGEEVSKELKCSGADFFMSKPFNINQLKSEISKLLGDDLLYPCSE